MWRQQRPRTATKRQLALFLILVGASLPGTPVHGQQAEDDFDALFGPSDSDFERPTEQSKAQSTSDSDSGSDAAGESQDANAASDSGREGEPSDDQDEPLELIPVASTAKPAASSSKRPPPMIEEIMVVAQKRAQREIDVPISMTVIDDDFMADQGIVDLADLSLFVPNAKITSSAVFPDIRIRGFGTSPLNPVFEQSVGLVLDGVPFGNKTFYQGALFDIEHVEVLRGPQGALHGKNTTAGLINLITHGPTDEWVGRLNIQSGSLDLTRVEGGFGGPLIGDVVNFRLAILDEQRGQYFSNTAALTNPLAPKDPGSRERRAFRVKLGFPNVMGSELTVTYDHSDSLINGGYELRQVPEHTRDFVLKYDPNADFEPYNLVGSFDHPDYAQIGVDALSVNWELPLGAWDIGVVAGYAELDDLIENDSDFSPTPGGSLITGRTTTQATAEVRMTSPQLSGLLGLGEAFGRSLGYTDLVVGVLAQRRRLMDLFQSLRINDQVLAEFAATEGSGGLTFPLPLPESDLDDEQSTLFYDDQSDTYALFGQVDWALSSKWAVAAGLRWSSEQRAARIQRVFDTENNAIFVGVLDWEEFDRTLARSDQRYSPKISLNWKPQDSLSFFLSWGSAYKAGGFNAFASGGTDRELVFEPEVVDQWAVDAKMRFGGTHSLNVSLFRMNLEDFQVLTTDPNNLTITIENAAAALSQGVELDWTWRPAAWLDVRGSMGFNDTEFLSFPIATCPQDMPNSDGDDEERCDVSGKPLVRAPRLSVTLTPTLTLPLSALPGLGRFFSASDLGLVFSLTGEYQGEQFLNDDLDDRKKQEAFRRVHGGIGIGNLAQTWSFRIAGQNLTDTRTAIAVGEIPAVAPAHFYQIPEPGRAIYGQFRFDF